MRKAQCLLTHSHQIMLITLLYRPWFHASMCCCQLYCHSSKRSPQKFHRKEDLQSQTLLEQRKSSGSTLALQNFHQGARRLQFQLYLLKEEVQGQGCPEKSPPSFFLIPLPFSRPLHSSEMLVSCSRSLRTDLTQHLRRCRLPMKSK